MNYNTISLDEWYRLWPSLFAQGAWYRLPGGARLLARASFKPGDKDWPVTWDLYPEGAAKPAFSVAWGTMPPTVFRCDHGGGLSWSELSLEDIRLEETKP
jgi:hypothetical protein